MGRRDRQSLAIGLTLTGCIVGVALADLSPSLLYQARHGTNAAMLFKSPAEGEVYGLKIRYLLTPTPDHPLGFVRRLEKSLAGTKFPFFENENEYTRLGTVGSIGLVVLIGLLLGAMVNARMAGRAAGTVLGPCAALTLACLLFATTGGFSTFFNTWVFPDIRAWARIFPYIGFFCVAAAGAVADPFVRRFPRWGGIAMLGTITILAVFDQAVPSFAFDRSEAVYRQDGTFEAEIEKRLPADSAIFQLPYVEFPNDNHPGTMLVNDSLRPYLHSAKYRWSAGAVSGMTSAEWNRATAALPVPEMLTALVHAGFAGLWLDRAGFDAGQSPEDAITHELGEAPLHDAGNRFLFYDLRSYHGSGSIRVQAVFERGFYFPENGTDGVHRWSLQRGRVTLINPLPAKRRVLVRMRIGTADGVAHTVRVGSDRMQVPGAYEKQIDMPASGRIALDITCDCPGVRTDNRTLYFWVSAFALSDV
jgi:phosphoglycerol transferase